MKKNGATQPLLLCSPRFPLSLYTSLFIVLSVHFSVYLFSSATTYSNAHDMEKKIQISIGHSATAAAKQSFISAL